MEMAIYMGTKIKGGLIGQGKAVYVLEAKTSKGTVTDTKRLAKESTTANAMAIETALQALKRIKPGTQVTLYTTNKYLASALNTWLKTWQQSNYVTARGKPVKNGEKWREVAQILNTKGIRVAATTERSEGTSWIKGETAK